MVRGCSGGAEHPLVKRASEIKEALLLLSPPTTLGSRKN